MRPSNASAQRGKRSWNSCASHRGPARRDRRTVDFAFLPWALPAGRRARAGKDADDQHPARTLNLSFSRIQFTPDLMPADITGTDVIEENRSTGSREFRFFEGPLFSNVILADEINRTPPKTQAALLEAMQERQVTAGRVRHALADPFFVLATQNPIEQEGTYPLPEAQQDRFMFKVYVKYPSFEEEFEVARRTTVFAGGQHRDSVDGWGDSGIAADRPRGSGVGSHYSLRLGLGAPDAGPRAGRAGFRLRPTRLGRRTQGGAVFDFRRKARALLLDRTYVTCEDIQSLAKPVLRHRLVLSFTAEAKA